MTKYKVGDVAALFSKPKTPTTSGGKKLQSLFKDYYGKLKSNDAFHLQEGNSDNNNNEEIDQSVSKKSRKRKFSASNDSDFNETLSLKKFKDSSEKEEVAEVNKNKKQKKHKKQKDFQQKNSNDPKFKDDLFSKNLKMSYEQEGNKNKEHRKFKMQQDFPRKNKQSLVNSFTSSSSVFPKFETSNDSENDMESPSASKLNNVPNDTKQTKRFIKKSKKKSLDDSNSKLSIISRKDISCKDSDDDSDDTSLKREIKEFMDSNSGKKKMEKSKVEEEKSFNWYARDTAEKPKKKIFLKNESNPPQNYEEASVQNVKSKKKNKNNNFDQQYFPMANKIFKTNSFNSSAESMINDDGFKKNKSSKKKNTLEQGDVKKPKKAKHELNVINADHSLISESTPESNKPKEMTDFIRKPKNKNATNTFVKDNLKKPNIKAFDNMNADKNFKNEEFSVNSMQKGQVKGFESEAPDFIKLSTSDDATEKSSEERLSRTLFVGNLPKNMSKQELRNLFSTFGIIEHVRLTGIETDKAKIYSKNPPKLLSKNYASETVPGFVVFKEKQSAVEALKLSGSVFKGHHITVDFALPAGSHKLYDNKRSIFVGNLPFNVQDESIWYAFGHCGRIEGVRVVRDRTTGLGKGFGYVLFSTVEAKQNAMSIENLSIEGREIRIKAVDSNKKTQKQDSSPSRRDTFKSRAIRMKKNKVTGGHKSIRKLTNKQKILHKKKKTAEILQKAMK